MLKFWRIWPVPIAKFLGVLPLLEDYILRPAQDAAVHKEYDASLALFSKAIEHYPNCATAYHGRGSVRNLMWKEGDIENALTDFNEAIRLDPRKAGYYVSRAIYHQ